MAIRKDQTLFTLDEIDSMGNVEKACTLGLVVDCTEAYFDSQNKKFIKKMKIVDRSFHYAMYAPIIKSGFCTVMFFSDSIKGLPSPKAIGDIIYLRRFAFEKYNQKFQGRSNSGQYCYWVLMEGEETYKDFDNYLTNRKELNLTEEKFNHLKSAVNDLRAFGKQFLQKYSIFGCLHPTQNPKDEDMIVRVLKKYEDNSLLLKNGNKELYLEDTETFMEEGDIGKLRSVAKILKKDGTNYIVKNNFTSLIKLREWTCDYKNQARKDKEMEIENQEDIYTDLATLSSAKIADCTKKIYLLKCEVCAISPDNFTKAVKYYEEKKKVLHDSPKKDTIPVYNLMFRVLDESTKSQLHDIVLFSHDGRGSNFLQSVNLSEINEYSTLKQESELFLEKYNQCLDAQFVIFTVQVLTDGKGKRLIRARDVKIRN